jgi:tetratricopeptide (TPR) repeat protein
MKARLAPFRLPALVLLAVMAAYANSFLGAFQFDDFNVIVDNPGVHSLAAWWRGLGEGIRPLLKLTYALNWQVAPTALGFHAVNLLIHLVNTGLVYALAQRLAAGDAGALRSPPGEPIPGSRLAATAALLFALHPAGTEAVTYLSGRSASLMATFYLGSILGYVWSASAAAPAPRRWLSPALFAFALATKEAAVSLPFVLLAWEASRAAVPDWHAIARRLAPQMAVLLAAAGLFALHPLYGHRLAPDLHAPALHRHLLTEISAVSYLQGRLVGFYPPNIDPDLRVVHEWSGLLALQALLQVGLLAAGLRALRRRPWLGFGILWFYLVLAPTNSLLPRPDLANDRHLYLATVGLCIAMSMEVERWLMRGKALSSVVRAGVAALVVVAALATLQRNRDYGSEVTLWEQTARVSPGKGRVYNNLGFAYAAVGRIAEARVAYRRAIALNPRLLKAERNLAALGAEDPLPSSSPPSGLPGQR